MFPHADGSATFNIGNTQVSPFWSQATMSTFPLHGSPMVSAAQVIATVFGPRVADSRGESSTDRAIVKCAYSEAHFAAGALPNPCVNFLSALPSVHSRAVMLWSGEPVTCTAEILLVTDAHRQQKAEKGQR